MNILFLDNDNNRVKAARPLFIGHHVVYCTTVKQAIQAIDSNYFDLYSLDHDLQNGQMLESDENSGFAALEHAITKLERPLMPDFIIIHSFNPVGAEKMMNLIYDSNAWACTEITPIRAPFGSAEYKNLLEKILNASYDKHSY